MNVCKAVQAKVLYVCKVGRIGKLEILKNEDGQTWWRTIRGNGREISRSSETFDRLQGCLRDLRANENIFVETEAAVTIAERLKVKI